MERSGIEKATIEKREKAAFIKEDRGRICPSCKAEFESQRVTICLHCGAATREA